MLAKANADKLINYIRMVHIRVHVSLGCVLLCEYCDIINIPDVYYLLVFKHLKLTLP